MSNLSGQQLHGYDLHERIGAGGHGTVYKAQDSQSGQWVAIKVMLEEHHDDDALIQRLRQEASILQDLRHPHIARLLAWWQDDNGVYLVMPWLEGGDLRGLLNRRGKLSPSELSAVLNQICSALDAAHAAQVIHRDLKPENILLDRDGNAYLTDFGFAKRRDQATNITTQGVIIGSPNYLSPEQISGETISTRADIYVLGVIIHEALTGTHPYDHLQTQMQVVMQVLRYEVAPVESLDIPPEQLRAINALINRCTAKKPAERYATASSVAYHFAEIIAR
ncbi:MAG: serine/threonine protein kinase [Anaerolineae bacterium]